MINFTTKDVDILFQREKRYCIKVDFLDRFWRVIGTAQGTTTDLTMSIDSESDIRRTVTLTLLITESDIVRPENMTWIDKYVKLNLGVYDFRKNTWKYYAFGRYVISSYDYTFSATESSLQLSLLDLMATFSEERGNQITTKASIPVAITVYPCSVCGNDMTHTQITSTEIQEVDGELTPVITTTDTYTCPVCAYTTNIRPESTATYADITNAMKITLDRFSKLPYNRYSFDVLQKEFADVPYDLDYDNGTYPLKIITDLRDLYPNYQTYFNADGVFVFSAIPTENEDVISLDTDIMDKIIISEEKKASYSEVCNVHDVWGQSLEADRTATSTVGSILNDRTIYRCTFDNLENIENDKTYCFNADIDNIKGADILFLNGEEELTTYSIPLFVRAGVDERLVKTGEIKANTPYVIKIVIYKGDDNNVYKKGILLGELQIRGIVKTVTTMPSSTEIARDKSNFACENIYYKIESDNPFAADIIGDYIKVCYGGEYDNIYSTELAFERGRYENYKTTRLNHSVTLTTLIVPFLDVNEKIRYTSPITGEVLQYIVKKIDISLADGTMTLSLAEFYPYYPTD